MAYGVQKKFMLQNIITYISKSLHILGFSHQQHLLPPPIGSSPCLYSQPGSWSSKGISQHLTVSMKLHNPSLKIRQRSFPTNICPKLHINKYVKWPMESKKIHARKNNQISIKILAYIGILFINSTFGHLFQALALASPTIWELVLQGNQSTPQNFDETL